MISRLIFLNHFVGFKKGFLGSSYSLPSLILNLVHILKRIQLLFIQKVDTFQGLGFFLSDS